MGFASRDLDRRRFLGGGWFRAQRSPPAGVTFLVHARPDRLAEAERAIAALPGLSLCDRDPRGRLTVVATQDVGAALAAVMDAPGVVTAALANPRGIS